MARLRLSIAPSELVVLHYEPSDDLLDTGNHTREGVVYEWEVLKDEWAYHDRRADTCFSPTSC